MSGDLAAEDRPLLAHAPLEERVPDPVHQRRAAVPVDRILDGIAGADVVDDFRARVAKEKRLGKERRHEVAGNELAGAVDEEAPVGVAVPGDADVGTLTNDPLGDVDPVLLDQRIGLVIGKGPVDLEAQVRRPARQPREEQGSHEAGHPAAGVEHDVEWLDDGRIDERHDVLDVVVHDIHLRERARRCRRWRQRAGRDHVADLGETRLRR